MHLLPRSVSHENHQAFHRVVSKKHCDGMSKCERVGWDEDYLVELPCFVGKMGVLPHCSR